jgi:alkyldihydroxyacetonephosphate synthase
MADTFETACTWERFPDLSRAIRHSVRAALKEHCGAGHLMMRFTHVYPDGPAPYFTYVAPLPGATPGASRAEILRRASAAWQAVKAAASDAIESAGGTITHHHAVGRTHRPWYGREVPPLFTGALRAAKHSLDPQHILNPGVLFDPDVG